MEVKGFFTHGIDGHFIGGMSVETLELPLEGVRTEGEGEVDTSVISSSDKDDVGSEMRAQEDSSVKRIKSELPSVFCSVLTYKGSNSKRTSYSSGLILRMT